MGETAAGVLRNKKRQLSSAQPLMTNIFTPTARQLLFTWCYAEVTLKDLNSCEKMKYGDQSLHVYQIMMQYVVCKNEEHYSFLVNSPRYDERARELSTEAGTRSFQKASKMGQAAENRGE